MAETAQLIQLLQNQMEEQRKQMEEGRKQTEALIAAFIGRTGQRELEQPSPKAPLVVIPCFEPFDSTTELRVLVFLTHQSRVNYKLLSNLASQQSPAKDVNALTLDEIVDANRPSRDISLKYERQREIGASHNRLTTETFLQSVERVTTSFSPPHYARSVLPR
ncbi:hypothetical protein EMCRGX_G017683 [Ephydatia muelleri]